MNTSQQIKEFFVKRLNREYNLVNKSEVLEKLEKCSDRKLLELGSDFKVNPVYVYGLMSQHFGVRTSGIF